MINMVVSTMIDVIASAMIHMMASAMIDISDSQHFDELWNVITDTLVHAVILVSTHMNLVWESHRR